MKTQDEIITTYLTPVTTFKYGAMVQAALLSTVELPEQEAANRLLAYLEDTEHRAIFLDIYTPVTITPTIKKNAASLTEMVLTLKLGEKVILKAIRELGDFIPVETLNLLRSTLVAYSPLHYVAVTTFVVLAMTLREEEVI